MPYVITLCSEANTGDVSHKNAVIKSLSHNKEIIEKHININD